MPKNKIFGSPLEEKFFNACKKVGIELIPQYPIDNFKLDFLYREENLLLAVEIDGSRYHKTKAAITRDYKRQRYLRAHGYEMIRFTGQEIYHEVDKCVEEFINLKNLILNLKLYYTKKYDENL